MIRLPSLRRRRVPYIPQVEIADCGAACLAMVLAHFGRHATLREVREVLGAGRGGLTLKTLATGGRSFGMSARGVRVDADQVDELPSAAILHWGFHHFVVLERVGKRGVAVVDPEGGPRVVPMEEFSRLFTGVALLLEPGEEFRRTGQRPSGVLRYLKEFLSFKGTLVRAIVVSALLQLFPLGLPLLTGSLVDRIVPRHDLDLIWIVGAGLIGIILLQAMATMVRAHLLLYLHSRLDWRLTSGFVDHMVRLPYAFFLERTIGDMMTRYTSNHRIREVIAGGAVTTLFDGALVALYACLVFLISPPMGLLVAALGTLSVVLFLATRRRYRDLMAAELKAQSLAHSELIAALTGMETLKALGVERHAVDSWASRFSDQLKVTVSRARLDAWVQSLRGALELGSPLTILWVGGHLVIRGELTLGSMLAVNALAMGFLGPLSRLVTTALDVQETRSHIERIEDVMTAPPEQAANERRETPVLRGGIRLEEACFRYGKIDPWVLQDVSLTIRPGQKVAIVGRSGAGKSTLARVLIGLYALERGKVLYDERNLEELDLISLRRQIGIVPQRARLFALTVRENIALGCPEATDEQVVAAARIAELHEDVMRFPMAYETRLAEEGGSLSGGQRQRLALARALLHRPKILMLDEATSELDTVTESRIVDAIDRLGCTRIVIAHRLSTVLNADRILVLDESRLVASGSHAELLSTSGIYAELVAAQAELPA